MAQLGPLLRVPWLQSRCPSGVLTWGLLGRTHLQAHSEAGSLHVLCRRTEGLSSLGRPKGFCSMSTSASQPASQRGEAPQPVRQHMKP